MPATFQGSNVVITAHQFNPSIFTQIWVKKHLEISDEEFQTLPVAPGSPLQPAMIFNPDMASIPTTRFYLLVLQDRLQFSIKLGIENEGDLIREKVGKIVSILPFTPYAAIGLNFEWRLQIEGQTNSEITRRLFFLPNHWLYKEFDQPNAAFGTYCSKEMLGGRLKLDVKPLAERTVENGILKDTTNLVVGFSFNYNIDLPDTEEKVGRILEFLGNWEEAQQNANRIMREVETLAGI